jgi:peptidoglycan/LPS O-acetylase OafA/YrhL
VGNGHLGYRPELDGLRAVAVVSVFLCHLGMTPFSGGYVGVDVFFVLSGFLITQIIAADLRAGRFSLANFYERRIRRRRRSAAE